jgi:hypothetical protein
MCFAQPKVPDSPAVPTASGEAARSRIASEMIANDQAKGRKATILTTPLGDTSFGKNVRTTKVA